MTTVRQSVPASLTELLAARLMRPVGVAERELAALHLLDWVATAAAAGATAEGAILHRYAQDEPPGVAHVLGFGPRDPRTAAYVNAGLALVLELDATHRQARLHPGPVVIAAALATAQQLGASGARLLDAIVRGYEAMVRVGEAAGAGHYRYFHPTSTAGTFGAAAAAASLFGLDQRQLGDALGNAGTRTGGLWQCRLEQTMSKLVHVGESAAAGVTVARLVGLGLTGPRQILEGERGLFAASCPDAVPEAVDRTAAAAWKISETSIKPWPGCRHAHPAVDAALRLRARLVAAGIAPQRADRVDVLTYPEALDFTDNPQPTTTAAALFSAQHLVAVALLRGEVDLDDVAVPRLSDPEVAALRARVRPADGEPFATAYPSRWGARVAARYGDREYVAEVYDVKGDPEAPMTAEDITAKARALLARVGVPEPVAAGLVAAVVALPNAADLGELGHLLP